MHQGRISGAWHHISRDARCPVRCSSSGHLRVFLLVRRLAVDSAYGDRPPGADAAQDGDRGTLGPRAHHEAPAAVLDLDLGQRAEVAQDVGSFRLDPCFCHSQEQLLLHQKGARRRRCRLRAPEVGRGSPRSPCARNPRARPAQKARPALPPGGRVWGLSASSSRPKSAGLPPRPLPPEPLPSPSPGLISGLPGSFLS